MNNNRKPNYLQQSWFGIPDELILHILSYVPLQTILQSYVFVNREACYHASRVLSRWHISDHHRPTTLSATGASGDNAGRDAKMPVSDEFMRFVENLQRWANIISKFHYIHNNTIYQRNYRVLIKNGNSQPIRDFSDQFLQVVQGCLEALRQPDALSFFSLQSSSVWPPGNRSRSQSRSYSSGSLGGSITSESPRGLFDSRSDDASIEKDHHYHQQNNDSDREDEDRIMLNGKKSLRLVARQPPPQPPQQKQEPPVIECEPDIGIEEIREQHVMLLLSKCFTFSKLVGKILLTRLTGSHRIAPDSTFTVSFQEAYSIPEGTLCLHMDSPLTIEYIGICAMSMWSSTPVVHLTPWRMTRDSIWYLSQALEDEKSRIKRLTLDNGTPDARDEFQMVVDDYYPHAFQDLCSAIEKNLSLQSLQIGRTWELNEVKLLLEASNRREAGVNRMLASGTGLHRYPTHHNKKLAKLKEKLNSNITINPWSVNVVERLQPFRTASSRNEDDIWVSHITELVIGSEVKILHPDHLSQVLREAWPQDLRKLTLLNSFQDCIHYRLKNMPPQIKHLSMKGTINEECIIDCVRNLIESLQILSIEGSAFTSGRCFRDFVRVLTRRERHTHSFPHRISSSSTDSSTSTQSSLAAGPSPSSSTSAAPNSHEHATIHTLEVIKLSDPLLNNNLFGFIGIASELRSLRCFNLVSTMATPRHFHALLHRMYARWCKGMPTLETIQFSLSYELEGIATSDRELQTNLEKEAFSILSTIHSAHLVTDSATVYFHSITSTNNGSSSFSVLTSPGTDLARHYHLNQSDRCMIMQKGVVYIQDKDVLYKYADCAKQILVPLVADDPRSEEWDDSNTPRNHPKCSVM